jgi:hypothetical protein
MLAPTQDLWHPSNGKWWMTTLMSFCNWWMKLGTLMACPLWWSSGRVWTGTSKIRLQRWCKEDQVMMIQRVGIAWCAFLILIRQQIRPSMKCSIRQHLFWQSDQSFLHQRLCFWASLPLQHPPPPSAAVSWGTNMGIQCSNPNGGGCCMLAEPHFDALQTMWRTWTFHEGMSEELWCILH